MWEYKLLKMVVVMISGGLGSGKTLMMTKLLVDKQKQGNEIFSNYGLIIPHTLLTKDVLKNYSNWTYNKCVIGIDELQVMLDSRSSMTVKNRLLSYWFLQTRKRDVYLLFTTQYPDQCEKRIRRLVDIWIECKKIVKGKNIYIITSTWYMGSSKQKKAVVKIIHANPYFKYYDTKEVIAFEDW